MYVLYLNNFRGFVDTSIPLKQVNFLIGENSTGKTSILALIHLMCSPQFWFFHDFNLKDYEFGGFRDILSASAERRARFDIGLINVTESAKTGAKNTIGYLLSYTERAGLPLLESFTEVGTDTLRVIRTVETRYRSRISAVPHNLANETPSNVFRQLSHERDRNDAPMERLPKAMSTPGTVPPGVLMAVLRAIEAKAAGREKDDVLSPHDIAFPIPLLTPDLVWLAPIRTTPRRTYDGYSRAFSPEGEHTPYILRDRLSGRNRSAFRKAINTFGKASGLFTGIQTKRLGRDVAAPFELLVQLISRSYLRVNSVGYGVSQVLPVVVEMLARAKHTWFAIQQPEVHLHPKAQAALGDLIFQVAENDSKHFLIETHSDFAVDRFRLNFKRFVEHRATGQVLFFERTRTGNQVSMIPFEDDGEYPKSQPDSFRQFFLQEQMTMLGL